MQPREPGSRVENAVPESRVESRARAGEESHSSPDGSPTTDQESLRSSVQSTPLNPMKSLGGRGYPTFCTLGIIKSLEIHGSAIVQWIDQSQSSNAV